MNNILNQKELEDLVNDYNKCNDYLINLNNGNINCLNEAIDFSNRKYSEFSIKDTEVVLMNTNFMPTGLDNISQTIQNLVAIKKMISEIIYKKEKN